MCQWWLVSLLTKLSIGSENCLVTVCICEGFLQIQLHIVSFPYVCTLIVVCIFDYTNIKLPPLFIYIRLQCVDGNYYLHMYVAMYICTIYPFHVTAEVPCEEESQKDAPVSSYL